MPSAAMKSRDEESVPDIEEEIACAQLSGLESDEEPGDAAQALNEEVNAGLESGQRSSSRRISGGRGRKAEPHPETLEWLSENYELSDGICLPRSALYQHYLSFCEKRGYVPVNAASFGKVIRHQFPSLTTRRLGTRGQSKYHYYGIGIKKESQYYDTVQAYTKSSGAAGDATLKKDNGDRGKSAACSPGSKAGTLLPDFPKVRDLILPSGVSQPKVETFIMMYRAHCQRILDTVVRANFEDVENFLLHFWQGMPDHLLPLLESDIVIDIVGYCDCLLYKVITVVLIPSALQPLPESLTHVIRQFARDLDRWLAVALQGLSPKLSKQKFMVARAFCKSLKRQASLTNLCQAARNVVRSAELVSQMIADWKELEIDAAVSHCMWTSQEDGEDNHTGTAYLYLGEFQSLLEKQMPLEKFVDWLDNLMLECTEMLVNEYEVTTEDALREFLLKWSFCGARLIRDLTLHSSPSFGSYHLLLLMFNDYILHVTEKQGNQLMERGLRNRVVAHSVDTGKDHNNEMTVEEQDGAVHQNLTSECNDQEKEDPRQQQGNSMLATAASEPPRKLRISSRRICSILPSLDPSSGYHPIISAHQHYPRPSSGPLMMGMASHMQPTSTVYTSQHMQLPGPSCAPGLMYGYGGAMGYVPEYDESGIFPPENGMLLSDNTVVLPPPLAPSQLLAPPQPIAPPQSLAPPQPQSGYFPPQPCYGQQFCPPDPYYGNIAPDQSQGTDPVVVS